MYGSDVTFHGRVAGLSPGSGNAFALLPPQNASGIVSFHRPDTNLSALREKLMAEKMEISLRTDRGGQHYLRISPHFYNTDEELHRLLEKL